MATWSKIKFFYDDLPSIADKYGDSSTVIFPDTDYGQDLYRFLDNEYWTDDTLTDTTTLWIDLGGNLGSELLTNEGFETAGGGGADIWSGWTENAGDGTLANETSLVNSGSDACKITTGASNNTSVTQNITGLTPGDFYEASCYMAADSGGGNPIMTIYDVSNASVIQNVSFGVGAIYDTYVYKYDVFEVPFGCTEIQLQLEAGSSNGHIAYFDDVSFKKDTSPSTYKADYCAIVGHNLATVGATILLRYGNALNLNGGANAFSGVTPTDDNIYLNEFTAPSTGQRFWQFSISGTRSDYVQIRALQYGLTTELDYANVAFDPNDQEVVADVNISETGFVQGIWSKYIKRRMSLKFTDADSTLYTKVKTWFESHKRKNFFVAYDTTNNPDEVYYMRADGKFNNPIQDNGTYRNISIELEGRKDD